MIVGVKFFPTNQNDCWAGSVKGSGRVLTGFRAAYAVIGTVKKEVR
jgi:hypothetical protein